VVLGVNKDIEVGQASRSRRGARLRNAFECAGTLNAPVVVDGGEHSLDDRGPGGLSWHDHL
jgi:hypothetical protein